MELRGIGVKVQSKILRGIRSQSEFRASDVQLVVGITYVVGRVQDQVFDVGREVREWGVAAQPGKQEVPAHFGNTLLQKEGAATGKKL